MARPTVKPGNWLFLSGLVLLGLLIYIGLDRGAAVVGDTEVVIDGSRAVVSCLSRGVFINCNRAIATAGTVVGPYPAIQYVLAVAARWLGVGDKGVLTGFLALSALGVLSMPLLFCYASWKGGWPEVKHLGLLLILTSPFIWYGSSSFAEPMAAALLLAMVVVMVCRCHPILILATALTAGLTKEFVPPIAAVIAVIGLFMSRPIRDNIRRSAAVLMGALMAAIFNAAFNIFRFGTPLNTDYSLPLLRTPPGLRMNFFTALWVSPNAGILWFWPLAVILLCIGVAFGIKIISRSPIEAVAGISTGGALLAISIGLGAWFAPFGWAAWGPRLLLPYIPALTFLVWVAYRFRFAELLKVRKSRPRMVALMSIGAVIAVMSIPQAWSAFNGPEVLNGFFGQNERCPRPLVIQVDADYYYECIQYLTWTKRPFLLRDASTQIPTTWAFPLGAIHLLMVGASARRFITSIHSLQVSVPARVGNSG